ncbi:Aspartate/glutamate/uridylate kinase [Corchorus olitorius]|uniref:Aspartate/glutamate/uridylate kinase n=1 Tax=Corchorus olitorius TaxID=93759 RepID=A0A1R3GNB5_9ROSI|nr:Aspartate/glutamate/uridylate kinase [Corchorus olitorius]
MMASVMNSMLLQSALEKLGVQTRMQSAFVLPEVAEPYSRPRAIRHLEKGKVVIFGGIVNADVLLKGTNVDGVYDCHSDNGSAILDHISFREVGSIGITSMDTMTITYCEENTIPGMWKKLEDAPLAVSESQIDRVSNC